MTVGGEEDSQRWFADDYYEGKGGGGGAVSGSGSGSGAADECYDFVALYPPLSDVDASEVVNLLSGFGNHFESTFGKDFKARLVDPRNPGVTSCVARAKSTIKHDGILTAHSSVVYDPRRPEVGLLANVFTSKAHRKRGLSRKLTRAALRRFDAAGGKYCILGTGSPHAAKMYESFGFVRTAGSFEDSAKKGYNPDDLGEVIMVRSSGNGAAKASSSSPPPTTAATSTIDWASFYSSSDEPKHFSVEVLERRHFAALVFLFTAFPGNQKFAPWNVDDGVYSEAKIVSALNENVTDDSSNACTVVVCAATGRIHGIAERKSSQSYVVPACRGAELALDDAEAKPLPASSGKSSASNETAAVSNPISDETVLSPNISIRRRGGEKTKKKRRKKPGLTLALDDNKDNDDGGASRGITKGMRGLSVSVGSPDPFAQSFSVKDGAFQKGNVEINEKGVARMDRQESFEGVQDDDLEMLGVLGRGASSHVNKARHKSTGDLMAVKVIAIHSKGMRAQIMSEVKTLYDAKCPCLVQFHGAFFKEGSISIALEYMDEGCLETVLANHGSVIPENILAAVTHQVLWGLAYLKHEKRVHRDIKPQNILCNSKGEVKLTDFGISKELESTVGMCMTFVGTFKYMSPERVQSKPYSYASDVWSLGLVLIECATGRYPYPKCSGHIEMVQTVLEAPIPELDAASFSPEFRDFCRCCLKRNPQERVPAEILLQSPWFKKAGATSVKLSRRMVRSWLKKNKKLKNG